MTKEQMLAVGNVAVAFGLDPADVISFTRRSDGTVEFEIVGPRVHDVLDTLDSKAAVQTTVRFR